MKKQFLFLAGSAIMLASCGSNNTPPAQTQAQIDSAINAKVTEHDAANAAKNDSTLKAIEKEKAEAVAKEHHEGKKHEGAKEVTPAPAPTPTVAPKPGGMKGHSDQVQNQKGGNTATNTGATHGGMKSHSDQNQGH